MTTNTEAPNSAEQIAVARAELKRLEADSEFRAALFDRSHAGHGAARARLQRLMARLGSQGGST